jgi:hypothetical protein
MIPTPAVRLIAAFAISASLLSGAATRLLIQPREPAAVEFAGLAAAATLRPGQLVGAAVFERVANATILALQLRSKGCGDPVFALPISLVDVAAVEVADAGYLSGGYHSVDVYRGKVRQTFSHFDRLIARSMLNIFHIGDGHFVRLYAPRDCDIANGDLESTALAILKLGMTPDKTAQASAPVL